ncbi:FAD-dependent monooxygenase [Neisseria gonorrhoeae]
MSTQFDVAVIGAGPAGSAASALLRKKGYQVCVLENSTFRASSSAKACCRTVWKCWKKPVLPMPFAPGPAFN